MAEELERTAEEALRREEARLQRDDLPQPESAIADGRAITIGKKGIRRRGRS